jgi:spore germination cell wall hydrolase CwlJ-like protein
MLLARIIIWTLITVVGYTLYSINTHLGKEKVEYISEEIVLPYVRDTYNITEEEYNEFLSTMSSQISSRDLVCLQQNIFFEARNQSIDGKIAIAHVTLNRVASNRFPNTVCDVVKQHRRGVCQFSWVCDRNSNTPQLGNIIEARAWHVAGMIAHDALTGNLIDMAGVGDSTHFHANYVNPWWSSVEAMNYVTTVGDHIFYTESNSTARIALSPE